MARCNQKTSRQSCSNRLLLSAITTDNFPESVMNPRLLLWWSTGVVPSSATAAARLRQRGCADALPHNGDAGGGGDGWRCCASWWHCSCRRRPCTSSWPAWSYTSSCTSLTGARTGRLDGLAMLRLPVVRPSLLSTPLLLLRCEQVLCYRFVFYVPFATGMRTTECVFCIFLQVL